jgi:hypothetical protein
MMTSLGTAYIKDKRLKVVNIAKLEENEKKIDDASNGVNEGRFTLIIAACLYVNPERVI